MNKLYPGFIFITLLCCCLRSYGQCDRVSLRTQAEVDAFPSTHGCTIITEYLDITTTGITHLDSLYTIQQVMGHLSIYNNSALTDLDGLEQLEYAGSISIQENTGIQNIRGLRGVQTTNDIIIWNNDALVSLEGLHNIRRAWSVFIRYNNSLTDLNGLVALDSIAYDLAITANPSLTNIEGLNGMKAINDLQIMDNASLTNIDGLNTIVKVRDIRIDSNPVLANIDGLSGLKTMRSIRLYGNQALEDLDGLSNVTGEIEEIYAYYNPALRSVNGLSGISGSIRKITVANNNLVENVDAFHAITHVGDPTTTYEVGLQISSHSLQNLHGLSAMTKIDGPLILDDNTALTDLSGLSSLKEVTGSLLIQGNANLANLDGLSGLEKVGEGVSVSGNSKLPSFGGLNSLTSIGGSLTISGNESLNDFSGLNNLNHIGGRLEINRNYGLRSLAGLDNLSHLGQSPDPSFYSLWITENDSLTTIGNLPSLKHIPGTVMIIHNKSLKNLNGLDSLKTMEGQEASMNIRFNESLENIDGLSSLETTGDMIITDNPKLTDLDGLKSLRVMYTNTQTNLTIRNNAMLGNIDGLSKLVYMGGGSIVISMTNNPALTRCCGLYPLLHSGEFSTTPTVDISGNGAGCTRADIEAGGPCEGVTVIEQPTNMVFTNVTDTSMHVSFTPPANAPLGYITLMRDNAPPFPDERPWDGGNYFVGYKSGFATVVQYGATTEFDVTGLTPNTTYYFATFSFQEEAVNGARPDFLVEDPLMASVKTGSTPNVGVSFSDITASTMRISFEADASEPEGYIVLMKAYGSPSPDDVPVDGTSYSVGNVIGSSTIVVGLGTSTSHTPMYLSSMTRYYFDVYSYGAGYDYDLDSKQSGNEITLSEDPVPTDSVGQPTNIAFTNVTDNSMTVSFTSPSPAPDGFITLMRAFGSPSPEDVPVDGTSYSVGNVVGSSTIVVGMGAATSLDVVYLGSDVEYYFDVYSFTNTSSGPDYLNVAPLQGHQRTTGSFGRAAIAEKTAPFPNPFVESISIPFTTTEENAVVTIVIHDQTGKKIAQIVSDRFMPGYHEVQWDRRDLNGNRVTDGLYVVSILNGRKGESNSGTVVAR